MRKIRKKTIYMLAIILAVINMNTMEVYAFEIPWVNDAIEEAKDGITSEIVNDIANQIAGTVMEGIDGFLLNVSEMFNPSLNLFYSVSEGRAPSVSKSGVEDGYSTDYDYDDDSDLITLFRLYSSYFGATLASVLFSGCLFLYFWNGKLTNTKNNPIQLLMLYAIALIGIYKGPELMDEFLEIAQDVWEWTITMGSNMDDRIRAKDFSIIDIDGEEIAILGVCMVPAAAPIMAIFVILGIYLVWLLFKGYLRLWLEMAERYLVVCLLVLFFPAIIPTIISKDTSIILKSYFRMFISQLFLLLTGYVFMKGFVILMDTGVQFSVVGYIFIMGYLRTAQRLDSYMASMGLNVAQTGGGLFDSFAMAAHSIGATLRGANEMRKGSAGLMKATGLKTGNKGLYQLGSIAGFNMKDAVKAGGISQIGSNMDFLKNAGIAGERLNANAVPQSVAREALNNFIKNPSRENSAAVKALHENDFMRALQSSGIVPNGMRITGANLDAAKGNIKVQGIDQTGNTVKGTISNLRTGQNSMQMSNGSYFTPDNATKKGTVTPVQNRNELNSALERAGKANASANFATMEEVTNARNTGNHALAEQMLKNGVAENVYESGKGTGTQVLTGINSPYGPGIPLGCVTEDGDVMAYSRFAEDADILHNGGRLSPEEKTNSLFTKEYTDTGHVYDPNNLPSVDEAIGNLSESDRAMLGFNSDNHGYGYDSMGFVENEDTGMAQFKVNYKDYDFDREQLSSLYPGWEVPDNAEPVRNSYGQQSIGVYNPETGETGTMYMSSVPVYGGLKSDEERMITGRYGDDYVVSVRKERIEKPEIREYETTEIHNELNFGTSPAGRANQRGYEDAYQKEIPQDRIDQAEAEMNARKEIKPRGQK